MDSTTTETTSTSPTGTSPTSTSTTGPGTTGTGSGAPLVRAAPHERDAGMATAEYAIATLAACGFAALLLVVLRGGEVQEMLLDLVRRALGSA